MYFEFSKSNNPIETSSLSLNTVYFVNADTSYDISKNVAKDNSEFVAIRTINGEGTIIFCDNIKRILPKDSLIILHHKSIKRYFCSDENWDFHWFEFIITNPIFFPVNKIININSIQNENEMFSNCLTLLRDEQNYSKVLASSIFSYLLYSWMYSLKYEKHRANSHYDCIIKLIEFLHSNLDKNIKVNQMAQMCNLSERRFREVFKSHTGKQPKKYYENIKMQLAKELLVNTSFSIGEIAIKLGYKNQFYFSHAFTKFNNTSPSTYNSKI